MNNKPLVLVVDNVRSLYNVGSLFRTADAAGAAELILVGITPHPKLTNDARPPHIAAKATASIAKTALGAEKTMPFRYFATLGEAADALRAAGYRIYALEQTTDAKNIFEFTPAFPAAIIVGHEREGVSTPSLADETLYIPQAGQKESLNVAVAAGIAMYWFRN